MGGPGRGKVVKGKEMESEERCDRAVRDLAIGAREPAWRGLRAY